MRNSNERQHFDKYVGSTKANLNLARGSLAISAATDTAVRPHPGGSLTEPKEKN